MSKPAPVVPPSGKCIKECDNQIGWDIIQNCLSSRFSVPGYDIPPAKIG